jgi:tetratricopeptide (TPR) repeat protein
MLYDYEEALRYHEQALDLAEKLEMKSEYAQSLYLIGADYLIVKNHDKALDCFQRALSIAREKGFIKCEMMTLCYLADLYLEKENYVKAKERLEELLKKARKTGVLWETASALKVLGIVEVISKNYSRAEGLFEEALFTATRTESPFLLWPIHFAYSQSLRENDQHEKANEHLEKARSYIHFIASNIPTDFQGKNLKKNFLNTEKIQAILG